MSHYGRIKETTTATATNTIALAGAVNGFRTFASKHTVGETGIELVVEDGVGNWLEGVYTLTNSTLLTRTSILGSSNSDGDVTFPAGTKNVFETLSASSINKLQSTNTTAFNTTIPLTAVGTTYMPQQTVSSVLPFTVAASPVQGALVYLRLVANGTNAPTFTGFKEWGGSLGYDNRNGIVNEVQFFHDGYDSWYSISQAVGAVAAAPDASAVTLARSAASGVVSTGVTITVGTNNPLTGSQTESVALSSNVAGTWSVNPVALSASIATATSVFTPSATGSATITGTATGTPSLTNGTIGYTVNAAATVPATMAAPVATGGDTTASIAYTVPADGGASISGYTITPYIGATPQTPQTFGVGSGPVTVTGLTNGSAYTFKMHASNSVGAGTDSPTSNSVTPAVAGLRLTTKDATLIESGSSGSYSYVSSGASATDFNSNRGVLNQTLQSGVDGSFSVTFTNTSSGALFGFQSISALTAYSGMLGYVYSSGTYAVGGTLSGTPGGVTSVAEGDIIRRRRTGSTMVIEVARAGTPTTWIPVVTYTGVSTGVLYFESQSGGGIISNLSGSGLA